MRLKEHGATQLGLHGKHGGVETLKMAGLQNAAFLFGKRHKFVGLREGRREWLFNEQMEPGIQKGARYCVVMDSGNGNGSGVEMKISREKFVERGEDGNDKSRLRFSGTGRIGLNGRNQGDSLTGGFKLAIDAKVIAAKCAGAHHCRANLAVALDCYAPLPSTAFRQRV
jgi:hypothetical protein